MGDVNNFQFQPTDSSFAGQLNRGKWASKTAQFKLITSYSSSVFLNG